ncbi:MAG: 2-C-methyl-D-erythritol 4-phosphate cytidylyltransferase [Steroidobacteraceae bacterium]
MGAPLWCVVPAAGSSTRLEGQVPKQYRMLAGRRVIEHSLAALLDHPSVQQVVVALAPADTLFPSLACAQDPRVLAVTGGRERCLSVLAGLRASGAAEQDWILVHDAARPCLQAAELRALVAACEQDEVGGLLALPLADTLKRQDAQGRVDQTLPRDGLWRALTPQMFRRGLLESALSAAIESGLLPGDEAAAVEAAGYSPRLVPGSPLNLKITYPEDLDFAQVVLQTGGRGLA